MAVERLVSSDLKSIENSPFEFVERKGIGHPDTLADGVAEAISIAYSEYCIKNFGVSLHQMLDKIMFMGGMSEIKFGIGEMTSPWRLVINGRLSRRFGNELIDCEEISEKTALDYLGKIVPRFDANQWLKFYHFTTDYALVPHWFNPRSIDDLPDAKTAYSNDTSVAFGYWPLSKTEQLALYMEKYFYDDQGQPRFPYIGQDIKVMCARRQNNVDITMCVPMFSQDTPDEGTYQERIKRLHDDLLNEAEKFIGDKRRVQLFLNTQDLKATTDKKSVGHYFVASGSALDYGEEGVVGRGNRSRGVISAVRPLTMEAISGKNPVYYVGKVYNYLADKLSKQIAEEQECECNVFISSRNSDSLNAPHSVVVQIDKKRDVNQINNLIENELSRSNWANEIIYDRVFIPSPGSGNGYRSQMPK